MVVVLLMVLCIVLGLVLMKNMKDYSDEVDILSLDLPTRQRSTMDLILHQLSCRIDICNTIWCARTMAFKSICINVFYLFAR